MDNSEYANLPIVKIEGITVGETVVWRIFSDRPLSVDDLIRAEVNGKKVVYRVSGQDAEGRYETELVKVLDDE